MKDLIYKNMCVKICVTLLIITMLIMFAPNSNTQTYNSTPTSTINSPSSFIESGVSDYTNLSAPLTVNSYAYGQNNSQFLEMYYISSNGTLFNASAQMILPDDWSGYYLYVYVYEISENRSWVLNPGFQDSLANWTTGQYDNPAHTNVIQVTFADDGHDIGDDAVEFFIDGYDRGDGFYTYDTSDSGWVDQTFTVPRGEIIWAGLKLDYEAWTDSIWGMTGMFRLYVNVEGTLVWSKSFDDIAAESTWYSTDFIEVPTSLFNLPTDQNISIRVGLEATQSVSYSPDIQPHARVDNVYLYLLARAKPSDINLKMNGITVQDMLGPNGEVYGFGNASQKPSTPFTKSPVLANFTWSPTPNPPDPNLDISVQLKADVALNVSYTSVTYYDYDISKVGKKFSVSNSNPAEWIYYTYVAVPTYYGDYIFNMTIPDDWTILHVGTPLNPSQNSINKVLGGKYGDGYIEVHVDNVTNSPNGFWYFKAQSPSYIEDIWIQKYDSTTSSWINTTDYRVPNITRVVARIRGPLGVPSDVTTFKANLTIIHPNGTIWYTEEKYPNSTGYVVFSEVTIGGLNTTAGVYTYAVKWANDNECGIKSKEFHIYHATTLYPRYNFYDSLFGDVIYAQVRYVDTDSNKIITEANVVSNWSTDVVIYDFVEQRGWHEGELNTTKLPEGGYYTVVVNASKDYYDPAQTTFTVHVVADTEIYSPEAPSVLQPWGFNITINVHYYRKIDGVGITGANVYLNWSPGYYSYVDNNNGWYTIELNTTAYSLGTKFLNITLTKPGHKTQTLIIAIRLRFHDSFFYNDPVETTGYTDNITVYLHYTDLETGDGITNESGKLKMTILMTSPTKSSDFQYWIVENGSGVYTLWINASSLEVGVKYVFNVNFTWYGTPYHANASLSFSVLVRGTRTQVIYDPLGQIPIGDTFNLTFYYIDIDANQGIPNATNPYGPYVRFDLSSPNGTISYTFTEIGSGKYIVTINTSQFSKIGRYVFVVNFTWEGNYPPQYEDVNNTFVSVVIRTRLTELRYTLPSVTRWGDNITILVRYIDLDLGIPIFTTNISTDWPKYSVISYPNGSYGIVLNTSVHDAGVYSLSIFANKTNYDPKQIILSIQLTKRNMNLFASQQTISTVWGTPINISVYLNDSISGLSISDAIVNYSWVGGEGTFTSYNNGTYAITLDTINASTGIYVLTITAIRDNYQTVLGQISIAISQVDTILVANETVISVYYGTNITIRVGYYTANGSAPLQNAYVSYSWEGGNGTLQEISPGIYEANISTTALEVGAYTIYISASSTNYQTKVAQVSVDLKPRPTSIGSYGDPIISVIWGQTIDLTFNLTDAITNELLHDANFTYNWPAGIGYFGEIGNTGNYSVSLETTSLGPGTYTLTIVSNKQGYHSDVLELPVIIQAVPMSINVANVSIFAANGTFIHVFNESEVFIPTGDVAVFILNLTDYYNKQVENATVTYRWEFAFGKMNYLSNGLYTFTLDTHLIPLGLYVFTITASEAYHETVTLKMYVNIILIPSDIIAPTELVFDEFSVINITVLYKDIWHGLPITNATVAMVVEDSGKVLEVSELGNGYYSGILSEGLSEGVYRITITARKQNYAFVNTTITVYIRSGGGVLSFLTPVGAVSGILAFIGFIGYIAYARYFSIPPLVRKINALLSAIRKNKRLPTLKGIQSRESLVFNDLKQYYQLVSDVVPPDLLKDKLVYPIALVEITSLEEEIRKDLEEIPGLSEEEREKLFESLTKIPPKDRKWFLEDLKRQMRERGELPHEEETTKESSEEASTEDKASADRDTDETSKEEGNT